MTNSTAALSTTILPARRIAPLIRMLASPIAGERDAAVCAMGRVLAQADADFYTLADFIERSANDSAAMIERTGAMSDREMIDALLDCIDDLAEWPRQFVKNLARRTVPITPRQRDKLCEVYWQMAGGPIP